MKRQYIVAVLLLLGVGVLSTYALSFNQYTLDESWGSEYTIEYSDASITLSDPSTNLDDVGDGDLILTLTVGSGTDAKVKLTITPLDSNGDPIAVDGDGATCTVEFNNGGSNVQTAVDDDNAGGTDFQTVNAMTSTATIDEIVITWSEQTGFESEYDSVEILVEDL